jgi:cytochrome c peroxidase
MRKQYREPGPRFQGFASRGTPTSSGKCFTIDQSNRAQALRPIGCNSALASLAVTALLAGAPELAVAQKVQADNGAAARAGAIAHAEKMRRLFPDVGTDAQVTPPVIQQFEIDPDPGGAIATFQPNGPTVTANNAFFQNLGTNGRSCVTCHQLQDGLSISAQHVQDRFDVNADEPLFRLIDGATCPSDDVSSLSAKRKAYALLLAKGLIRIGLPMPSTNLEFKITDVDDPYGCNTNPTTGLTGSTSGTVSIYRRPSPTTNLGFLSAIMWDGRESSLFDQAVDATRIHAEGTQPPTSLQQQQIVAFEGCTRADTPEACANTPENAGVFTAQISDQKALSLSEGGANGGPIILSKQLPNFFIGINDPLGQNPTRAPFSFKIFDLYGQWASLPGRGAAIERRQSIARGEELFNTTKINITGVGGLNDALNQPSIPEAGCGTCHDAPQVGHHSVKAPLNIGVADAGAGSPPGLDISGLPVFTIWCTSGELAGRMFEVTDPGRALITGKCADIGKLKGPILRGLAARAPYFHNGSAATLSDVVDFYDQRFSIEFTAQQKADLVAFLSSL